jgi:Tol biopolymer transport system component
LIRVSLLAIDDPGRRTMRETKAFATVTIVAACAVVLAAASPAAAQPWPGNTRLLSVSGGQVQGDQDSRLPSVDADGRFVAFTSLATNLVPGDTNESADIFVRDRRNGTTTRVSVSSLGAQGDRDSGVLNGMGGPSISADGRYVAFDSEATNLVPGDTNGTADVFVHDRQTATTQRVSVGPGGTEASGTEPAISGNGRFVAFVSFADTIVPDTNFGSDIFVHDRQTGITERISQAPDGADANNLSLFTPKISHDGRWVYFTSFATNLVPGDPDNGGVDAYLFDRATATMSAITSNRGNPNSFVLNHGTAGAISANGRYLTFTTADDAFITPDTNGFNEDAWLVDRVTGASRLIGVNDNGRQGDQGSVAGPVSQDGRRVAFVSRSTNLGGPNDFRDNVYVFDDRSNGRTRLVSVGDNGAEGDLDSNEPAMDPDGDFIVFASRASTFVPENQGFFASDIFVRIRR